MEENSIGFDISNSKILDEVKIIKPSISNDLRGNIWTSFVKSEIEKMLPNKMEFVHDKFSKSKRNVLRGIHGDARTWKLVTAVYGEIYQVVVDLRKESRTYKKWEGFEISSKNKIMVLIPPFFGNAYYVKSNLAIYHYKLAYSGKYIDSDKQFTHIWNDKSIDIDWPSSNPILSCRDKTILK